MKVLIISIDDNLANKIKQSNLNYVEINTNESFDLVFKEKINKSQNFKNYIES